MMARRLRLLGTVFAIVAVLGVASEARAWGCEGHQITALIAETHMTSHARSEALKVLALGPIDPNLPRSCSAAGLDAFVDASTWADDERAVRPETGPWHFVDIPRGATKADIAKYCPIEAGCVISALTQQLEVLRLHSSSAQERGDALRYVIHLVGDIHQPLHTSTNNDRGGNCVPVSFFGREPVETNLAQQTYSSNLHEVWDVEIIECFSQGRSPQQIAAELDRRLAPPYHELKRTSPSFQEWAWESHEVAETTAYGKLPHKVAIEQPREVASCADDNDMAGRMLRLHVLLGKSYQHRAAAVVQEQLEKAGLRLAALLNSLWP